MPRERSPSSVYMLDKYSNKLRTSAKGYTYKLRALAELNCSIIFNNQSNCLVQRIIFFEDIRIHDYKPLVLPEHETE